MPSALKFRLPRAVRPVLLVLVGLLALPYLLTPLYAVVNPSSTLMLWRRLSGQPVESSWVSLSALPPHVPLAVIVAEDGRFCSHFGIDFTSLQQALESDEDERRGASTLTQQTVKNLFLWPGRSYVRKALEFPLAMWADLILSKRRILEIYLNIAEWGPAGQFGIEAGSRYAFGRPAQGLSRGQAALLAAVLPNPAVRHAKSPGPGLRRLGGLYTARLNQAGGLDSCLRAAR